VHYYTAERMPNVPQPARTVMFTDTAFARADGIQEYAYCEPFEWVDSSGRMAGALSASVHFRHRGLANVAWCDGHVSAEPPSRIDGSNYYGGNAGKWKIGWFGPSANNGYWNPHAEPASGSNSSR
jgi:prepilin-type processing-associated H-X9-DG protein